MVHAAGRSGALLLCGGPSSFLPGQAEDGAPAMCWAARARVAWPAGPGKRGPHQALLQLAGMQRKRGIGVGLPDELEYLHLHEVSA